MPGDRVTIKGTSYGLIITFGPGAWSGLIEELDYRLGERASFFKGGRVALQVGLRQLSLAQLEAVGQILDKHQVTLWAVESQSPDTHEAATQLGLEVGLPVRQAAQPVQASQSANEALVVQRTLRSGQVIHHPGHVIVIGDINPGAEIRAGGSVIVWGRLRGTVYAGTGENQVDQAVVCALQLSPTQLRIGDYIARSPTVDRSHAYLPEMAYVQNGQIVAEPWKRSNE
jgi:septum site-determining protein MinC